jgi:hypothetical protein
MPRMGPTTAACKNCEEKSLPWNWTVFFNKSLRGIGCPSAPSSRGPDGVVLEVQGIILNVAVSPGIEPGYIVFPSHN